MKTVLIVEDDKAISALLAFMIEREGFSSKVIADGAEAREYIKAGLPPALVLLDVMLPRADGFELLNVIRAQLTWEKVPVLMLTCRGGEQDISRAFDAGADDYVVKPFQPDELKARIRKLLKA
ncbi:MAG: hypothetical protein RIR18_1753 [Pseudomonadota bacterium]|jgi:DNA-binding response OmpR family regulator